MSANEQCCSVFITWGISTVNSNSSRIQVKPVLRFITLNGKYPASANNCIQIIYSIESVAGIFPNRICSSSSAAAATSSSSAASSSSQQQQQQNITTTTATTKAAAAATTPTSFTLCIIFVQVVSAVTVGCRVHVKSMSRSPTSGQRPDAWWRHGRTIAVPCSNLNCTVQEGTLGPVVMTTSGKSIS